MLRHRLGLALTGVVLLCAGALALAGGFGAFGPAFRSAPVINGSLPRLGSASSGFWTAVAAVGGTLALAGLIGLTAQLKAVATRRVALGRVAPRVAARVATANLVDEVGRMPDVHDVRVRLAGTLPRPRLVVTVTCAAGVDVALLQREIGRPIQRARVAVGRSELHTVIRYRVTDLAKSAELVEPVAPTVAVQTATRRWP
jgi:hypothetical protein